MEKTHSGRMTALLRGAGCAILLTLLAFCGYVGARGTPAQTVSVPLERQTLKGQEAAPSSMEEVRERLNAEREQELALLQSVIDHPDTDAATLKSALEQKVQIAARMEDEAQTVASLSYMGFADVAAVCGAQMITVITPAQNVENESDRTRMIDAAASQTGMSADAVKIILVKK